MQILLKKEADQLLLSNGLMIGEWNELTDVDKGASEHTTYLPSRNASELYVVSILLAKWISDGGWSLLQFDNSTSPLDDEVDIFERLVLASGQCWNIGEQRTFVFNATDDKNMHLLGILIFFTLLFEWHVYITSETSKYAQRLGLQDGVIHFFGDRKSIVSATKLIDGVNKNPLKFV